MDNKKYCFLLLLSLLFGVGLKAQTTTYSFTYDAAGNNTDRYVFVAQTSKSTTLDPDTYEDALSDSLLEQNILLYPNPTTEGVNINIQYSKVNSLSFELFTLSGTLLLKQKYDGDKIWLDMESFIAGTYVLKISSGEQSVYRKIIKY